VDLEKIKELMEAMEERGMTKLALKDKSGFELELERSSGFEVEACPLPSTEVQASFQKLEVKEGFEITSPMVGTYYSSPSPDDDAFVKVGDSVTEESVVCIIEAMKVMNEVKAGRRGIISEIFLDRVHPVEFGTKLFRIV